MALNKEIWVEDIKEQLLPDNTFVTKGTDYSAFADNHQIHIPVETGLINVEKDRSVLPGTVTTSDDTEAVITMHHFTTDPVRVYNPEDVELSYDKRRVITEKIAKSLNQKIATEAITAIAAYKGGAIAATAKVLDILREQAQAFDEGDYPETDRYVVLSAAAYAKLLKELTDAQTNAFLACADAETGVIGNIFGLNIMKRSTIADNVAYIAWHKSDYNFALGDVEIYTQENAPEYYGTVISASARFGAYLPPVEQQGNGGNKGQGGAGD